MQKTKRNNNRIGNSRDSKRPGFGSAALFGAICRARKPLAVFCAALIFLPGIGLASATGQAEETANSVRLKIGRKPLAAQANAQAVAAPEIESESAVKLKVGGPPSEQQAEADAKEKPGVSLKVSRPPAAATTGAPEQTARVSGDMDSEKTAGMRLKVGRPPVKESEAPEAAQPEPTPAAEPEEEVPFPEPVDEVAEPELEDLDLEAVEPEIEIGRIGAEDVGAEPEKEIEIVALEEDRYTYMRGGKLNPFRPLTDRPTEAAPAVPTVPDMGEEEGGTIGVGAGGPSETPHIKGPLEHYTLDTLELVAIMRTRDKIMALIQVPGTKQGFVVRKGTFVGSEGGRVSDIDLADDKIVVSRTELDMFDEEKIVNEEMTLQKRGGEF